MISGNYRVWTRVLAVSIMLATGCATTPKASVPASGVDANQTMAATDKMPPEITPEHARSLTPQQVKMTPEEIAAKAQKSGGVATAAVVDCGFGRTCPEKHHCCVLGIGFWCCPDGKACDFDNIGCN
jgi:hypothetical protein